MLLELLAARDEAHVFLQKVRTAKTIWETGVIIFVVFYCGKDSDSLTDLRYLKHMEMDSSSRTIKR